MTAQKKKRNPNPRVAEKQAQSNRNSPSGGNSSGICGSQG